MKLLRPVKINLADVDVPRIVQPELLYHFPIPPALHRLNPRLLLGKRWWNKTRKAAYRSNRGFCQACGVSGRLDAHERYELDFKKLIATYQDAVPLCRNCHMYIHWLSCPLHRKVGILKKGNAILLNAGLPVAKTKMDSLQTVYVHEQVFVQYTTEFRRNFWSPDWKLDLTVLKLNKSKFRKHPERERLIL